MRSFTDYKKRGGSLMNLIIVLFTGRMKDNWFYYARWNEELEIWEKRYLEQGDYKDLPSEVADKLSDLLRFKIVMDKRSKVLRIIPETYLLQGKDIRFKKGMKLKERNIVITQISEEGDLSIEYKNIVDAEQINGVEVFFSEQFDLDVEVLPLVYRIIEELDNKYS